MSYMTITINRIDVIGYIWMPNNVICAMSRDLTAYDIENIGELTRDNIRLWIDKNFGDFSQVTDFRADIGDFLSEWEHEESDFTYDDCMFPQGEFDEVS